VILEHIATTGNPNPQLLKQAHDLVLGIDEPSSDELLPLAALKNNAALVVVKSTTSLRALRNIADIFTKTTSTIPLENAKTLLDSINVNLRMVEAAIASLTENRIELNPDQ
jgi:hypothetical protein